MSDRRLGDWLDSYMIYTHNSEPPTSFKKWVGISCIASCLQRRCFTQWESTVYPNLYVVLCGPSGCRKGTAMGPGADLLYRIGEQIEMSPDSVTREQLVRRLKNSLRLDPLPNGKTIQQASLTIFSEELTVFLGYNNLSLMADLCNWYDCPNKWDYETKGQGKDHIINIWVNLIGATTPRLLQTTLPQDSIGGGLTARIIFVMEYRRGRTIPRPFLTKNEIILGEDLLHDLNCMLMMHGEFIPTEAYLRKYEDWYMHHSDNSSLSDWRFEGYVSRRATHIRKLSMVLSASRNGKMTLEEEDFDRALAELSTIEVNMKDVFRGVGRSDISSITRSVVTTIVSSPEGITFSELLSIHQDDADYDTMTRIFQTLLNMTQGGVKTFRIVDKENNTIRYVGGSDG